MTTTTNEPRRLKLLCVSTDLLPKLFARDDLASVQSGQPVKITGFPPHGRIVGGGYDYLRDEYQFQVECPTFPPCVPGEELKRFTLVSEVQAMAYTVTGYTTVTNLPTTITNLTGTTIKTASHLLRVDPVANTVTTVDQSCEKCNGKGGKYSYGNDPLNKLNHGSHWYSCQDCSGSGRVPVKDRPCRICDGSGIGFCPDVAEPVEVPNGCPRCGGTGRVAADSIYAADEPAMISLKDTPVTTVSGITVDPAGWIPHCHYIKHGVMVTDWQSPDGKRIVTKAGWMPPAFGSNEPNPLDSSMQTWTEEDKKAVKDAILADKENIGKDWFQGRWPMPTHTNDGFLDIKCGVDPAIPGADRTVELPIPITQQSIRDIYARYYMPDSKPSTDAPFARFTDRARRCMTLANAEAHRWNHEYVGTEHMLLGLVKEGNGVAAHVLTRMGVDLKKINSEVEKIVQGGMNVQPEGKLALTPRARASVHYAIDEANELGHNYVGTEHVLLGLLGVPEGIASEVLVNLGLTLDAVRRETLMMLGHVVPVAEQPPPLPTRDDKIPSPTTSDYPPEGVNGWAETDEPIIREAK